MNNITVHVLNPEVIAESEKMMVCAARMTRRGHIINDMASFLDLYNKPYKDETAEMMYNLNHPAIQKFGVINIAIVGASRRFLAQITRHQNEVKFMSASLQYSDYSGYNNFVIPYNILGNKELEKEYIDNCTTSMKEYTHLIEQGIDNDQAGYIAPQGLRNVLIISATPYQFKHMIKQRICRHNTVETRYVMLLVWEALYKYNPKMFASEHCCACYHTQCHEGKFTCAIPMNDFTTPTELLHKAYPKIYNEGGAV